MLKCSGCNKKLGVAYHYWKFDLCPKCNGKLFLIPNPEYIPIDQIFKYKLLKIRKENENNG